MSHPARQAIEDEATHADFTLVTLDHRDFRAFELSNGSRALAWIDIDTRREIASFGVPFMCRRDDAVTESAIDRAVDYIGTRLRGFNTHGDVKRGGRGEPSLKKLAERIH